MFGTDSMFKKHLKWKQDIAAQLQPCSNPEKQKKCSRHDQPDTDT